MLNFNKDIAIKKITEMPKEQVAQVLIFMAGMEAEHIINEQKKTKENAMSHKE